MKMFLFITDARYVFLPADTDNRYLPASHGLPFSLNPCGTRIVNDNRVVFL